MRAQYNIGRALCEVSISQVNQRGDTFVLNPHAGWDFAAQGTEIQPTLVCKPEALQELVDDLWRMGIRPTEGKVSDSTLQAQEEHIKSLQAVTKHLLEIEKLRV